MDFAALPCAGNSHWMLLDNQYIHSSLLWGPAVLLFYVLLCIWICIHLYLLFILNRTSAKSEGFVAPLSWSLDQLSARRQSAKRPKEDSLHDAFLQLHHPPPLLYQWYWVGCLSCRYITSLLGWSTVTKFYHFSLFNICRNTKKVTNSNQWLPKL